MTIHLQPVIDYGLVETAALLTEGFSDYVVPIEVDLAGLLHMVSHDGLDVSACRILVDESEPVGVALIARRGWTSRLAGMAVIPAARGRGFGRASMALLLDEARARGEHRMVLEVIEGNEPAIALYESCGFSTSRRLLSFAADGMVGEAAAGTTTVDIREASSWVMCYGWPDLPWQMSGENLAQFGPPYEGWQLGEALAVISDPAQPVIALRSLIVRPDARRQGAATSLMRAMMAIYPNKGWRVPAVCPEEAEPFFDALGFTLGTLSQRQMACDLRQSTG